MNSIIITGDEISSARVNLCGKNSALTKHDSEFKGWVAITCEGEGHVVVMEAHGREIFCHIGYVTPGADQAFGFTVENGRCVQR
jgi:hypothetical protein